MNCVSVMVESTLTTTINKNVWMTPSSWGRAWQNSNRWLEEQDSLRSCVNSRGQWNDAPQSWCCNIDLYYEVPTTDPVISAYRFCEGQFRNLCSTHVRCKGARRRNVTMESAVTSYVQGTGNTNQFCVWPTSSWDHDQRILTVTLMEMKSDEKQVKWVNKERMPRILEQNFGHRSFCSSQSFRTKCYPPSLKT